MGDIGQREMLTVEHFTFFFLGEDLMRKDRWLIGILTLIVLALIGCASGGPSTEDVVGGDGENPTLDLSSPTFSDGDRIPELYTCDGEDISPPLEWGEIPADAESLALVMEDPDAPARTWVHWVAYNIPTSLNSLPEAVPAGESIENGIQQGKNSWSNTAYGGPCPPSGTHRYVFYLYALDKALDLEPNETTKADLLAAVDGHVLDWGRLMGRYSR
jgi:hypothetical protein